MAGKSLAERGREMFSAGFVKSDHKSLRRLAAMAGGKLCGMLEFVNNAADDNPRRRVALQRSCHFLNHPLNRIRTLCRPMLTRIHTTPWRERLPFKV